MALMSPITETTKGLKAYVSGVRWLKSHPKQLMLVLLPVALGGVFLFGGWTLFASYQDAFFQWAMFEQPSSWWGTGLYYVVKAFLYLAVVLLGLVGSLLVMNIFASPIYEYISMVVETDLTSEAAPELSLMHSLKLMGEELKKVVFILTVSVLLLLIPGLNVISTIFTAFLVGWDFYDYALARRGWSFRQRLNFVLKDFWAVMGFGLWLVIPFVQFFMMPFAIAGGTMLSVESLRKLNLLKD